MIDLLSSGDLETIRGLDISAEEATALAHTACCLTDLSQKGIKYDYYEVFELLNDFENIVKNKNIYAESYKKRKISPDTLFDRCVIKFNF